ncbi:peroxiredoxin-like family protein [Rubritalea tangerina]|uniref:thioredoxin-dependent peroxiredoxin n=1 Tax=Rubritalea tangerina TaxID=430798 RepID=A0ABW4ZB05_9BACT
MKFPLIPLTALALCTSSQADSLSAQLEKRAAQSSPKITPEIKAEFRQGIEAVKQSGVTVKAKQVGDQAPDFTLTNATGKKITLSEQLKDGPVVLTWYRGGWCPYCNITLAALQKELPAITATGASLLALTPELPDKSLSTKEKNALSFEVLSDLNNQVASQYGLLFKLTPDVEKRYAQFFDLKKFNGANADTDTLPLAATYIIGQDGKILWAFLHHDYRKRAEPSEISSFLEKLKDQNK